MSSEITNGLRAKQQTKIKKGYSKEEATSRNKLLLHIDP